MSRTDKRKKPGRFACWVRRRTKSIKTDLKTVWLCAKDPEVPLLPKLVIGLVIAYAVSPIDLIPDFIPVIGYLDDVLLIPLGIALAVRLIPPAVYSKNRKKAARFRFRLKKNWLAAVVIILIWALLVWAVVYGIIKMVQSWKTR